MESFKDFKNFLEAVQSKDSKMVKLEIINMFIILRGSKPKILDAINYAIEKNALQYEKHQLSPKYDWVNSDMEKFTFESGYLEENFSKERLDDVFKLYDLVHKEANNKKNTVSKLNIQPQNTREELTTTQTNNSSNIKNIVIVILIIIAVIFLLIKN